MSLATGANLIMKFHTDHFTRYFEIIYCTWLKFILSLATSNRSKNDYSTLKFIDGIWLLEILPGWSKCRLSTCYVILSKVNFNCWSLHKYFSISFFSKLFISTTFVAAAKWWNLQQMTVSCAFLQHHKKYPSFNLSETYEWMDGKMEERALLDQMYFLFRWNSWKSFRAPFWFFYFE